MSRPISDAWFHRIKSATRDLVKMAGGVVRAGEIANASKSEVSRWQSATDADVISLPAALALEGECGVPLVTSVMAELNGRRLSDPDAEGREASNLFARHAEVLRSSGEMASQMAAALADGRFTPAEAEHVDRAASEMEGVVRQLRRDLAAVRAGAGLRVVGD